MSFIQGKNGEQWTIDETIKELAEELRLEHESSNWRGYFLCSAFVIEAINGGQE